MDQRTHQVGQQLHGEPARPRVGAHQESRRQVAVRARERIRSRHRAGRPRSGQEARADDAHTDLSLREDPVYAPISKRFLENPADLEDAFAKAWFKLLHRDMGPRSRYLGPLVPQEPQLWQDPVPDVDHELIGEQDIAHLKAEVLASGVSVSRLVATAWAAAASYRGTDKRGGANGARLRLSPQKDWEVNDPAELAKVLPVLEGIQAEFNGAQTGGKRVSLADLIVLAGCAAVEQAARDAGHDVQLPFAPGRTDASQEWTDAESFAVLEPAADGFRNYVKAGNGTSAAEELVERACLLTLTAPEMTALVGGMRVLNANTGQSAHGVFTDRPGALSNDFFVNLLDMSTQWQPASDGVFEGRDGAGGTSSGRPPRWTWCSARTPSCAPSRKSTAATTGRRRSCATSPRPGTR